MHKMMEEIDKICEMKNTLITRMAAELSKGLDCVNTQEAGEVVDMIKDLCDAEKNCYKAKYYCTVTKAMEEYEDDDGAEHRYGYDNWRYSSGRFAPTGRGHFAGHGYTPMEEITRLYRDKNMMNPRMGYVDPEMSDLWGQPMGYDSKGGGSRQDYGGGRYGMSYNQYQDARRHYTETHSKEDKERMDRHAAEHVADTVVTLKEIWGQADPETKKKLKGDLSSLMNMVNSAP